MKIVSPLFSGEVFHVEDVHYVCAILVKQNVVKPTGAPALKTFENHFGRIFFVRGSADFIAVPVKHRPAVVCLLGGVNTETGRHLCERNKVAHYETKTHARLNARKRTCKPVDKAYVSIVVHHFAEQGNV